MAAPQRHTIYIRCRPPELWAALTEGQTTRHYYYESLVESSFEPGAAIRYVVEPDEDPSAAPIVAITGEVVAVDPERSLVHTFAFTDLDEPPSTVRWTLSPNVGPGVMRVEVAHEGFTGETEGFARIEAGWPVILSGLKSWLETGTPLEIVGFVQPD